jgi:hypothetical protein
LQPCDKGTLRSAIKQGMLHQALPNGAVGVRLAPAVELLLDVAYALQYLHSMQLVHGDVKVRTRAPERQRPAVPTYAPAARKPFCMRAYFSMYGLRLLLAVQLGWVFGLELAAPDCNTHITHHACYRSRTFC